MPLKTPKSTVFCLWAELYRSRWRL